MPTISIIIATYNSQRTLEKCLSSIREQTYPQKKIEIILVDAGSSDQTLDIGKKYKCKIIIKPGVRSETAKAYGLLEAKGELIADFGSDNILPKKDWLKNLVMPLKQNKEIIASYPLRYHYRKNDTIFNRYVALFGVNDPVPFCLGKADRLSYLYKKYSLSGELIKVKLATKDKYIHKKGGKYYIVRFTPHNMPTLGANGFMVRKHVLKKAQVKPEKYFHIDVVYDLVKMGYNKFAVVDTSIVHDTADTLFSLLKKRSLYFSSLYLTKLNRRRYHIVSKKDYPKLAFFILFSLTFIQPLFVSLKGYRKKADIAWFIHPVFCFLITLVYIESALLHLFKNTLKD